MSRRWMLLLFLFSVLPSNLEAATIPVTTGADEFDLEEPGVGCSLREAIQAANTDANFGGCATGSGADSITLPSGPFLLTRSGPDEDDNQSGDLDIRSNLTINFIGGPSLPATIDGGNTTRVFQIHPTASNVLFRNITITHGRANDLAIGSGGGILNWGGLTLEGVAVVGNNADSGGGVANGEGAELSIQSSTFEQNGASNFGGGIFNDDGETIRVRSGTFIDNLSGDDGAGIYSIDGDVRITGSTFEGNQAVGRGGAVFSDKWLFVESSTFSGNSSQEAGGAIAASGMESSLSVVNSTITNNRSFAAGGGIYVSLGVAEIVNSTITFNVARRADLVFVVGGGVAHDAARPVTLSNSIVFGNESEDCSGGIDSGGGNIVGVTDNCVFRGTAEDRVGGSEQPLVFGIGALGFHGLSGILTQFRPLTEGSSLAVRYAQPELCPETDQLGNERFDTTIGDTTCDSGAFESRYGDGIISFPEVCDDANGTNTDACVDGQWARCGDGFVQPGRGETCEDGVGSDVDADCNSCVVATCGDGVVRAGVEECDDGNTNQSDDCRSCRLPFCGDGIPDSGEQCDDGDGIDSDECTNACQLARCGDSIRGLDEECDFGGVDTTTCNANCTYVACRDGYFNEVAEQCERDFDTTGSCDDDCTVTVCGDGLVNDRAGETCDDNNNVTESCAYGERTCEVCASNCQEGLGITSFCGDGDENGSDEQCDDGNLVDTDACTNTCQDARCGDGFVGPGEACDDGNEVNTDMCTNACQSPRCGDGFIQSGEACDDGDAVNSDTSANTCRSTCRLPSCGDGVTDEGEGCDDGNIDDSDACLRTCVSATCGDGAVQSATEQCDNGTGISATAANACRLACVRAFCGDGIVDDGEACDDGNNVDGDVCTNACQVARCGDGILGPNEACDDANVVDTDACISACRLPTCGDGFTQEGEVCDAGADNGQPNRCNAECSGQTAAVCGNRVQETGEACDAGQATQECDADCTVAECGDGVTNDVRGEQCDDGIVNSDLIGNVCRSTCQLPRCGDGVKDEAEACDDGNAVEGDACTSACVVVRPSSSVKPGESISPASGGCSLIR
ncbi:MAG: DUF4215 domain-containing protein [Deltaproteobacteria bacterium]|nr:DUF4215 domain-containing protein [Deltaproteobacteria bacterium]